MFRKEAFFTDFGLAVKNGVVKNIFKKGGSKSIRMVDDMLIFAISQRASDVHLEPMGTEARIRFRIDGKLQDYGFIDNGTYLSWLSRLKIVGGLDIGEKRLPQDGHLEMESLKADLRIATLPTTLGEKVAIRILSKEQRFLSLDKLHFLPQSAEKYKKLYTAPNGMILLTGPTGSGKTTTLYATLNELNKNNVNIVTIEDPAEYKLVGINQVNVNLRAGLTFAKGLRSIVRQDPDIIMVGEIRDEETAAIALQAALTGHLVFSTLHTNTAIGAVSRLLDMGIPRYLLAAALRGVVGQRLVRKICPRCITTYKASAAEKELLGIDGRKNVLLSRGTGCPHCNGTGYNGRIALHEVFAVSTELGSIISQGVSEQSLMKNAAAEGFEGVRKDAVAKVLDGYTTIMELMQEGIL